jgi:hypothetical protein
MMDRVQKRSDSEHHETDSCPIPAAKGTSIGKETKRITVYICSGFISMGGRYAVNFL